MIGSNMKEWFEIVWTVFMAIISVVSVIAVMKYKTDQNFKNTEKLGKDLDSQTKLFNALTTTMQSFMEGQKIKDQYTIDALKGILDKLEKLEDIVYKNRERLKTLEASAGFRFHDEEEK